MTILAPSIKIYSYFTKYSYGDCLASSKNGPPDLQRYVFTTIQSYFAESNYKKCPYCN